MKSGDQERGQFFGIKDGKVWFLPEGIKYEKVAYYSPKVSYDYTLKHKGKILINDGKWMLSDDMKIMYTL